MPNNLKLTKTEIVSSLHNRLRPYCRPTVEQRSCSTSSSAFTALAPSSSSWTASSSSGTGANASLMDPYLALHWQAYASVYPQFSFGYSAPLFYPIINPVPPPAFSWQLPPPPPRPSTPPPIRPIRPIPLYPFAHPNGLFNSPLFTSTGLGLQDSSLRLTEPISRSAPRIEPTLQTEAATDTKQQQLPLLAQMLLEPTTSTASSFVAYQRQVKEKIAQLNVNSPSHSFIRNDPIKKEEEPQEQSIATTTVLPNSSELRWQPILQQPSGPRPILSLPTTTANSSSSPNSVLMQLLTESPAMASEADQMAQSTNEISHNRPMVAVLPKKTGKPGVKNFLNNRDNFFLRVQCPQMHCEDFVHRTMLNEHLRVKHSLKPFVCNVRNCRASCETKPLLTQHRQRVHTSPIIECSHCQKGFTKFGNFDNHFILRHCSGEYACPDCRYSGIYRISQVRNHMRELHRQRHCPACPFETSDRAALRRHLVEVHGTKSPVICSICKRPFNSKERYRIHLKTDHNDYRRLYRCAWENCAMMLPRKKDIDLHIHRMHFHIQLAEEEFVRSSRMERYIDTVYVPKMMAD